MLRLPAILLTRAVRIALIVLVLLFVAYTVLGFWLVPRLVRSNLAGFASEQYHRAASIGEIRFNPFTLKLEMRDFSLPDADDAQLLGFERLLLNFDVSSVWRVGASFAAVELDQPFVRVLLRPDGSLNLVDLSHLANPGPPSESDETPRVFIDHLSVSTGRVAFEDRARATPFATELRPITFELRDFSTGGESGNAYSLRGASLDGESFAWSGSFRLTPLSSSGRFEVSALKARTVWSYLREALAFELTKGVINLNGEYFYDAAENGGLRLAIHQVNLTDLGLRPPARDYDYVEIAALAIEETQVNVRTRRVDIGRLRLDGGALRASRDAEGRINLTELAGRDEPAAVSAEPAAAPAAAAPPWVLAAPDMSVANFRVDFHDELVKPAADFSLNPIDLSVKGFSTSPDARLAFDASAKGEKAGELKLRGEADANGAAYQVHVEVNEFNLASLQPYLSTYTQITLNSAWLSSAMDLQGARDGAFTAKGDVVVNKLAAIDNTLRQDLHQVGSCHGQRHRLWFVYGLDTRKVADCAHRCARTLCAAGHLPRTRR